MIRAYIFDLDGTLLDTLQSLANSFNRTLAKMGYPMHSVDAYRYFIGDGLTHCIERCMPADQVNPNNVADFAQLQQADYASTWQDDVAIYSGITTLLTDLGNAGHPLCVLSNKHHAFAVRCVNHFFGPDRFQIISGFGPDVPHKPDTTGAMIIANQLGLQTTEIAFIGDTATDMHTATRANMLPIGALWGFRDAPELNAAGAKHIIDHPSAVLAIGA